MRKTPLHVFLFFTWDVSLALWKEKGLLEREVKYYQRIAEKNVRITFLSWGNKEDPLMDEILHKNINVIEAYHYLPRPRNKILRALLSPFIIWVVRENLRTCDLIKTNQMWGAWCAILAKVLFRKPLFIRTGFELYKFTIAQGHGFFRRTFVRFFSAIAYKTANLIYLATEDDRNFLLETFRVAKERISIHPNWIDTNLFKPLNIKEKDNSILFVGRLTEQKNLPLLIEAIAGTCWNLDIIGEGELRSELEELAQRKEASVNFLGTIPNDQLPIIYNSYAVFVLPSSYEGNPKTLLEAMSCGRAVIGTNVDGIRTIIRHNENGLLSNETPEALRAAIRNILSDTDLKIRLRFAAREQIKNTQAIDYLVEKEVASYKAIVK